MISIYDYIERSLSGPIMRETDFDLQYSRRVRQLAADFEITYNPEEIIPNDTVVEAIFEAGVELLAAVGLYNKDTQRVIQLTKSEIMEVAKSRKHSLRFGKGREAVAVEPRGGTDKKPPVLWLGAACPLTQEAYIPACLSFALIPEANAVLGGFLLEADGFENRSGYPHELIATCKEVALMEETFRRAGRPGLFGTMPVSATSPAAIFNAYLPGVLDGDNGMVPIQIMPELKVTWDRFNFALFCRRHNVEPFVDVLGTIGAYARNPGETAVTMVANALANWGFSQGSFTVVWSTDARGLWNPKKDILWTNCAVIRVLDKKVGNPTASFGTALAGPMTEMAFLESAAYSVAYPAAGVEVIIGGISGNGMQVDQAAGLHGHMVRDVSSAAAGLTREQANRLITVIGNMYDHLIPNPPQAATFMECYDPLKVKPRPEFVALYESVKEKLAAKGVPLK